MNTKILLCGVGGQGTILAAHILAHAAMLSGFDVKVSEIHGMAQRGGAVTTSVIFGDEVHAMVCGEGEADVVIAFEKLEALRCLDQLKCGGYMVVNDLVIKPASVLTGKASLPADPDAELARVDALLIPAENEARAAGNQKASNTVLLGAVSNALDLDVEMFKRAIEENVPPKTVEVNIKAFEAGAEFGKERRG